MLTEDQIMSNFKATKKRFERAEQERGEKHDEDRRRDAAITSLSMKVQELERKMIHLTMNRGSGPTS